MSINNEYVLCKNKQISIILIVLIILVFLLEFCVPVCHVMYSDSVEYIFEEIDKKYIFSDVSLINMQAVTMGTTYNVSKSTNEEKGDIVLINWIDPRDLTANDHVYFRPDVQILVTSYKKIYPIKFSYEDTELSFLFPKKVILVTNSASFYADSHNGKFYLRDLSVIGHIRFYVGILCPVLRCTW